jgi:hypothetical protein
MQEEIMYKYWLPETGKWTKVGTLAEVPDKWYTKLVYRRYTEPGSGPARGQTKVGGTKSQQIVHVDYIVRETSYGTFRDHVLRVNAELVDCKVLAITQRRKMNHDGTVDYYDSWFKLQDEEERVWWNSGADKKHWYHRIGSVNCVNDVDDAIWNGLTDLQKVAYLTSAHRRLEDFQYSTEMDTDE